MKPFYSNKKKIIPQLTDDWEINFENTTAITLFSPSLNQEIISVPAVTVLKFINDNNLEIRKNKIIGIFSVNTGKLLVNQENFGKNEPKVVEYIEHDDLEIGETYIDEKGSNFIYLGYRYVSNIKKNSKNIEFTKVNKKHFMKKTIKTRFRELYHTAFIRTDILTKKVIKKSDEYESKPLEYCEKELEDYYNREIKYAIFEKDKPISTKIGLVETDSRYFSFVRTNVGIVGNKPNTLNGKFGLRINLDREDRKEHSITINKRYKIYDLNIESNAIDEADYGNIAFYETYRFGLVS